ncbi:hypothetical protein D1007_20565 [Hordeum vulgare]|nr:hypothetical protein D1007_20565 [Hordeum vulgare]
MSKEAAARRNLSPPVQFATSSTCTVEARSSIGRMERATGSLNQGGTAPEKSGAGWGTSRGHDGERTRGGGQCRAQSGTDSAELNRGWVAQTSSTACVAGNGQR